MLEFPYQPERILGPTPPSLAPGTRHQWRPLIPVKLLCPNGVVLRFDRALVDSGSHDTVLPIHSVVFGGIPLLPSGGHRVRWSGVSHDLQFGRVDLKLEGAEVYRWTAVVGFTSAAIRYPILGIAGFLEFFDVTLQGDVRVAQLVPNSNYHGSVSASP